MSRSGPSGRRPSRWPVFGRSSTRRGWWPERGERELARLLEAGPAVAAWEGERLVGFARAVTDGVSRAYLEDVIVSRDQRGRGIGGRLVRAIEAELGEGVLVSAFFHAPMRAFYEQLGYTATRQVVAHRRRDRASPAGDRNQRR